MLWYFEVEEDVEAAEGEVVDKAEKIDGDGHGGGKGVGVVCYFSGD